MAMNALLKVAYVNACFTVSFTNKFYCQMLFPRRVLLLNVTKIEFVGQKEKMIANVPILSLYFPPECSRPLTPLLILHMTPR